MNRESKQQLMVAIAYFIIGFCFGVIAFNLRFNCIN